MYHPSGKQWINRVFAFIAALAVLPFLYSGQDNLTRLEQAQQRGSLTVLTRNGASSYFIGREGETGPEYDLAAAFAAYLGLDIEVEVADEFGNLGTLLDTRQGELIAANLTRTPDRENCLLSVPTTPRSKRL